MGGPSAGGAISALSAGVSAAADRSAAGAARVAATARWARGGVSHDGPLFHLWERDEPLLDPLADGRLRVRRSGAARQSGRGRRGAPGAVPTGCLPDGRRVQGAPRGGPWEHNAGGGPESPPEPGGGWPGAGSEWREEGGAGGGGGRLGG